VTAAPARTAGTAAGVAALLALPLLGLLVLLASPALDVRWEDHRAHFWLVLATAAVNAALAYGTGVAARRRGDVRVFLVSLAFLASAGFLGLHALATPGVLLDGRTPGFVVATPVGLVVAAALAAASARTLGPAGRAAVMRHARTAQILLVAVLAGWGALSLLGAGPLGGTGRPERASGPLVGLALLGVGLYAWAVVGYWRLWRRRRSALVLGVACAWVLLAEATLAVAAGRDWHASWWEWHLLMLAAFALIAVAAQREWHEERFAGLYADGPGEGVREVSVLFADLTGFTGFSERHHPRAAAEMVNRYLEAAIPEVARRGGEVDRIIGDAVMATFNRRGDQPDHADRAARAAVAIQRATAEVAATHAGWPRVRVGVNTGEVAAGVVGAHGGRTHTVIGDAVNLAARLEALAPPGGVVVGDATARRLHGARLRYMGRVAVRGRADPVDAHLLLDAPDP
jgi:class 3 adenylate cyclase